MNEKETAKKMLPPYVPYRTLLNFLDNLKQGIPQRIDRSIIPFKSMSGTLQGQLMLALEYLNLIADNGDTLTGLSNLVHSEGTQREQALKDILIAAYPFLFEDELELDRATQRQLDELFAQAGATGDTLRKCVVFFLNAAKGAGLKLSPHFKKVRGPRTGAAKSRRKESPIPKTKISSSEELPPPHKEQPSQQLEGDSWENRLLSKFPTFDPAWPDEVKSKWFDDFKELMALKKN
ncbi:MAG: hypothetical protein Q8M54_03280 [Desulfobaccales bacterium]|nr:hypothetical protein [Desulfobaccales bacterium]